MEVDGEKEKSTLESVFAALCVPFILCMCEKLQMCCFFFPSAFSSCNYEYGKKCQYVLGDAVDIREVAGYFLEVHCLMIVVVRVLHMPGTRQVI